MAPRANWRGYLKIAELSCPVALYTAAATSERIAFHILNRDTGHRVRREFVDSETGKPVEADDQAKGYEVGQDEYVMLDPDEIAAAVPDSDKTLRIETFIPCADVDVVYLDRPYYLAPGDRNAAETFALIREGLRAQKVAALAQTVLFRRVRTLLVRPHGEGLVASTMNFDYEVRSAEDAFSGIGEHKIKGEMLDLAKHIISTKKGRFDPAAFEDRYEAALAELVKAKIEGREIEVKRPAAASDNVVDLMEALRQSAGGGSGKRGGAKETPSKKPDSKRASTPRRGAKSTNKSATKSAAKKAVKKSAKTTRRKTRADGARRKAS